MVLLKKFPLLLGAMTVVCGATVGTAQDVDDPDFDYLEPEQARFFSNFRDRSLETLGLRGHPSSYTDAKRRMYGSLGDSHSLYCGCPTNLAERIFDQVSCGYAPLNDNDRARRLEAEHIVPAFWIAHFNPHSDCWVAQPDCGSGRECCLANDLAFATAHNDLVNLYPTIGELNADRSNYLHGLLEGEDRAYGACDFEVDSEIELSEPRENMRGDIARVHFYMRDVYGLEYPEELAELLENWNETDPVSDEERERNERIQAAQGSANPLVAQ